MDLNGTTPHISPPVPKPEFPGYYALVPLVLLILVGGAVAVVFYIRRRARLEELRHRLIPLYTYDPAEDEDDWGDADIQDDEEELVEPLYKEAKLHFTSG
ncbi:small integral membrane protein 29-like [Salarias fasciatus]|uniref:small integral membrane protein 29-like n=1 Tax=Salarias fasciatus TaxID=181472 RepID=UPI0011768BED|nr:small integral membrane protein 29-like [Salarias fasciatus]